MGFFSKPKTPDYAKIQADAAAKEKAALADNKAKKERITENLLSLTA